MQHRVLVRADGLAAFRQALVERAIEGDAAAIRRRVVIVPTRASAELFRQTIEDAIEAGGRQAVVLPDLLTREDWLHALHASLPDASPLLTRIEREVVLTRAAEETLTRRRLGGRPFQLRPGLVAAMLDFYDDVRRRQRNVRRFARALFDELRVERGTDRGSEGLIEQTAFLGFTFLAYERARRASGALDEHALRDRLLADQPRLSFDHALIAVADHPSDPRGLWPADFDMLGRLRHVARIDIVMTDETHDAGFRERLEQEMPGIEEQRAAGAPRAPRVARPVPSVSGVPVFLSRDREEELRDVARAIRRDGEAAGGQLSAPTAIVFHRPLPYLYLAQQVLGDARIPYQAFDALPLAAEPYAGLLDLVMAVARTGGTRDAVVALLRSTLARFDVEDRIVTPRDAAALDAVLSERRATGDASSYAHEVDAFFNGRSSFAKIEHARAARAAVAARDICEALHAYRAPGPASARIALLARFLREHEQPLGRFDHAWERHVRARAAVLGVLDALADAYRRHADRELTHDALTAIVHHAVENRTFSPRRGQSGVHLVDGVAARFGEFDTVYLVGLVETEWPERSRRTIFYASALLKALGWPQEPDDLRTQRAGFRDLLHLARRTVRLSAFQLEGDAILGVSPMVEAVADDISGSAGDSPETDGREPASVPERHRPIFADELITGAVAPAGLDAEPAAWLMLRHQRPPLDDLRYHGFVDPRSPRAYRVSAVDRYITCPFKYFSEHVLGLPEEREESSGLTPIERGTLMHSLFERFYQTWQASGRGAITSETLPAALELFATLTRESLAGLPEPDRALEETRLLGSIVGRGVADGVFELEVDAGLQVTARLLEQDLTGTFTFPTSFGLGSRAIDVRGKADRIDVLQDGALRVVDYKLGKLPDMESSVQVAVYAHCAQQMLEARGAAPHAVQSASYLAFGDDRKLEGAISGSAESVAMTIRVRASQFAETIARIEEGRFPAKPARVGDCQWCRYAGVCRKEYLIEADDSTDAL